MTGRYDFRHLAADAGWVVGDGSGNELVRSANPTSSPLSAFAVRIDGVWHPLGRPDKIEESGDGQRWSWSNPAATVTCSTHEHAALQLRLACSDADAISVAWEADAGEHFYGLGERFDTLDQRGKQIELWVKNGASGLETYKPVPWIASSKGYGIAIDTTHRVFVSLAHPTTPKVASAVVEAAEATMQVFAGASPAEALEAYTAWVGRPSVPPDWFFRPWKSRDWRIEDRATVLEDLERHQAFGIPLGAKLIDACWEREFHDFTFADPRFADAAEMIDILKAAGVELVLWMSPNMNAGTNVYAECARMGFLITDSQGAPYVHRLGNQPGWEGTAFDFTNPSAVEWWQEKIRMVMEMGVRGLKTDFGEQVPRDARFYNGQTGAEMHNAYPVLYNRATWEVVKEYDGVLMARSAWAGSQPFPGIWAGDQSPDFSPWAGLPSAIVAGQSAGWSGFPYWGSDVGGYFNAPDDEVFARWAQFSAVSPLMQPHGLGKREPWEFSEQTLDIYTRMARLHDALLPYSLMAADEAQATGMPLMRAMALLHPEYPEAHLDWVQYQFQYGPDLLAAPVYSWGASRLIWFPPGDWIDFETGDTYSGPLQKRVPAPREKLPLYVRAGSAVITASAAHDRYEVLVYPGVTPVERAYRLHDGSEIVLRIDDRGEGELRVRDASRPVEMRLPHHPNAQVVRQSDERTVFHVS